MQSHLDQPRQPSKTGQNSTASEFDNRQKFNAERRSKADRQQFQQHNREQRVSNSQNRERQLLHGVPRANDGDAVSKREDDNPYGDPRRKPLRKSDDKEKGKAKKSEHPIESDSKASEASKKGSKRPKNPLFTDPYFDEDSDESEGDFLPLVPPEKSSAKKDVHGSVSGDHGSVSKEIPANRQASPVKRKTDGDAVEPQPMAKKVKSTGVTDSAFPQTQQPHGSTSTAPSPPAKKGKGRAKRPSEDEDESKIVKKTKKDSNAASSKAPATSKSSSPVAQPTMETATSAVTTAAAAESAVKPAPIETTHSTTTVANTVSAVTTVAATEPVAIIKLQETDRNGNVLNYRVLRRDYVLGSIPGDDTWYIVHSPAIPTLQEALSILTAECPDDGDIRGMIQEVESDGTPSWTYLTHSWGMQLKLETMIVDQARRALPKPSARTPLRTCFVARMLTTTHPTTTSAGALSHNAFKFLGEFPTLGAANDAAMRAAMLVKWPAGGAHNAEPMAAFAASVRDSTAAGHALHVNTVGHRGEDIEISVLASHVPVVPGAGETAAVAEGAGVAADGGEGGAADDGEGKEIIVISSDEESDVSSDESEDGAANGDEEKNDVEEEVEELSVVQEREARMNDAFEKALEEIGALGNEDETNEYLDVLLASLLE